MLISVDTLTDRLFGLSMADTKEDAATAVADIIAELWLTCDRKHIDFTAALDRAKGYRAYEIGAEKIRKGIRT